MKNKFIALFSFLFLVTAGCRTASEYDGEYGFSTEKIIMLRNYEAAEKLATEMRSRGVNESHILIVTTLA
ncbi:MAG: hypothetical protein M3Y82_14535, partial [Verrucomicrobiota bacterium]|nr:hypothetical protein [Verrucomicrobiota bacterium]